LIVSVFVCKNYHGFKNLHVGCVCPRKLVVDGTDFGLQAFIQVFETREELQVLGAVPNAEILHLVPVLYLREAGLSEHRNELVDVCTEFEVRDGAIGWASLELNTLLSEAPLGLIAYSKEPAVLLAAPNSEGGHRTWLEHAVSFSNLALWAVDQLQDQVGHVAREPRVRVGQSCTRSAAPNDQLPEIALLSHDLIEWDLLAIANVVGLYVDRKLVAGHLFEVARLESLCSKLHHRLGEVANDRHWLTLLPKE